MVLLDELQAQHEEAQTDQSGGGRVNNLRQPKGGGKGETVTYVNEDESD
jgi:hypothetical protein